MNESVLTWRSAIVALLLGLMLAVAGLLVPVLQVSLLIFVGLLFGIFLNGITRGLAAVSRCSYHAAFVLTVMLVVSLVTGGLYYMGSHIAAHVSELSQQLRAAAEQLNQQLLEYEWTQRLVPSQSDLESSITDGVLPRVVTGLQSVIWGLGSAVLVAFVGLYVAYSPSLYRQGIVRLVPPHGRQRADQVLDKVHRVLGFWIVGRLLSMSLIGVLTAVGLWLLGVPLPLTLGVLAALLTFIPNLGPLLAAVPQTLLAMQVGINTVVYVLIFNAALQGVESYVLTPIIQRYQITLPPAVTIAAQVLMGILAGLIGVMTAAPLAAAILVLVQMLYIRDLLGDEHPGQLAEE